MTEPYCTRDDVFLLGLSAQAFVTRARAPEGVDPTTGILRLKGHGFDPRDLILLEVQSGGALPDPALSVFVPYSPVVVSFDLFRIAGFIAFASTGKGFGVAIDPARRIDRHILEVSAEIDECLTANAAPLIAPFPEVVIGLAARMTARAAVLSLSVENPQYRVAVDRLMAREVADRELLAIWRQGKPINPRPKDQTDEPDNGAMATAGPPAAVWVRESL